MKKTKHHILYLFLVASTCMCVPSSNAQWLHDKALADSLLNELPKAKNDTVKFNLLIKTVKAVISNRSLAMHYADSAMHLYLDISKLSLAKANDDTAKVLLLVNLSGEYVVWQVDSSIRYAQSAIKLARQLNYKKGEAAAMHSYGDALWASGNYDKAIEIAFKALNLSRDLQDIKMIASSYIQLAVLYQDIGDYALALKYGFLSKNLFESITVGGPPQSSIIAGIYILTNQPDSASIYIKEASDTLKRYNYESGYVQQCLGDIEVKKKNYKEALNYYWSGVPIAINYGNFLDLVYLYNSMAQLYYETGNIDSSIYYAKEELNTSRFTALKRGAFGAITILAKDYKLKNQNDSTIKYLELSIALNDSLFNKEKTRAIQNLTFNEQLQQQEKAQQQKEFQNTIKLYSMLAALVVFLLIAFILWRNNRRKQKLNTLLQKQKEQIERTLVKLKSTQAQLIQSEKMASLGELTAGIAHEIQNPLNFVNNFSEVNTELIDELKEEVDKGNITEIKIIADGIKDNEQKILHHGKRADAIVKGMLQHSRASTGKKEPTDINALTDEYLRLSYHGMRAKDKSFNATLQTDFDNIEKINVVPQDIGRVLLNLFNNAFYAVSEKKKVAEGEYEPVVSVDTKKVDSKVEILVKDNGVGIPQKVVDKIFQPFFTTKPTGQGTGLGLSLSYDIIKAQGGEITVQTKEGEGSEFSILLPTA
jgi:two-component system NtrC family sensor kinase